MLNRDNKVCSLIFGCLFLVACTNRKPITEGEKEKNFKNTIDSLISRNEYLNLYNKASDSLDSWYSNNLLVDSVYEEKTKKLYLISIATLDSIICINSKKDKLIGVVLQFGDGYLPERYLESIEEFYGAKINEKWYFWGKLPLKTKRLKIEFVK